MDINDFKLFNSKKIILCVSGGVDSMVLLYTIFKFKNELNINMSVCHFEHGIRGNESKEDMDFVVNTCNELGVPVFVKREDIPSLCGGVNVEQTARDRRYAFFYDVLNSQNADYLVLAHHKNDNCETVLMNMIRGCGVSGLCGMPKVRGQICRPFLGYTKEQISRYAAEHGIAYREDSTNKDTDYFRNQIRHELIPLMEKHNSDIVNSVDKMRGIIECENDFLKEYTAGLPWIIRRIYGYDIKVENLKAAHRAIRRRSVYYVLGSMLGRDFDSIVIDNILNLTDKNTGKKVEAGDITVYRQGDSISFVKNDKTHFGEYELKIPGVTSTPFGDFKIDRAKNICLDDMKNAQLNVAYFSFGNCPLFARPRNNGDVIVSFGGGHKKLKDVFIDQKIPVFLRGRIPIIHDGRDIVFVPGVIRSDKYPFSGEGIRLEYISEADLVKK